MKKILYLILAVVIIYPGNEAVAQSKAITEFEEKVDGYNLFLYQSLIRVLNQDKNDDFNMLIKDLDHLKFLMTDSIGSESIVLYKKLMSGLNDEGFEELMTFDQKDSKAKVYSLDEGDNTNWVVIFNLGSMSGLFEMQGSIDTKYLHALSSLDLSKLKNMMPMLDEIEGDFENEFEEHHKEE